MWPHGDTGGGEKQTGISVLASPLVSHGHRRKCTGFPGANDQLLASQTVVLQGLTRGTCARTG